MEANRLAQADQADYLKETCIRPKLVVVVVLVVVVAVVVAGVVIGFAANRLGVFIFTLFLSLFLSLSLSLSPSVCLFLSLSLSLCLSLSNTPTQRNRLTRDCSDARRSPGEPWRTEKVRGGGGGAFHVLVLPKPARAR